MDPGQADQVTPTLEVLVTRAVNCAVPEDVTVAAAGVTVTVMVPTVETVIWNERVAVCLGEEESVTWTVKLNVPV
jgi:hypothetical protein